METVMIIRDGSSSVDLVVAVFDNLSLNEERRKKYEKVDSSFRANDRRLYIIYTLSAIQSSRHYESGKRKAIRLFYYSSSVDSVETILLPRKIE